MSGGSAQRRRRAANQRRPRPPCRLRPAVLRRLVSARDARRFLRRFAPQIVHVHFMWHGVRSPWPLGMGRLVVSPYGTDVEAIPAGLSGIVARCLVRITLARAHALVTASDYLMARTLELGAVREQAIREVIGFGVDAGRFAAAAGSGREEGAEIVIGFAKGLRPYYGAADLLEAVARLRADGLCVRLRVAGLGPSEAELRQRAITLGLDDAVEWLGHVPEGALPDFFAGLDMFAMPSHREAYGVAALEAASAGGHIHRRGHEKQGAQVLVGRRHRRARGQHRLQPDELTVPPTVSFRLL